MKDPFKEIDLLYTEAMDEFLYMNTVNELESFMESGEKRKKSEGLIEKIKKMLQKLKEKIQSIFSKKVMITVKRNMEEDPEIGKKKCLVNNFKIMFDLNSHYYKKLMAAKSEEDAQKIYDEYLKKRRHLRSLRTWVVTETIKNVIYNYTHPNDYEVVDGVARKARNPYATGLIDLLIINWIEDVKEKCNEGYEAVRFANKKTPSMKEYYKNHPVVLYKTQVIPVPVQY